MKKCSEEEILAMIPKLKESWVFEDAAEMLQQLLDERRVLCETLDQVEEKRRWVPVSELPEPQETPYTSYIVWAKAPNGEIEYGICEVVQFDNRKRQFEKIQGFFSYCEITHYMNKPPPPKKEG